VSAPGAGQPGGTNPDEVYDLFRRGSDLLDRGDFAAAAIPLERARAFEPDKK
jgi:hypothetical protein